MADESSSWLFLDEPQALLARASTPPWANEIDRSTYTTRSVSWEPSTSRGSRWEHEVIWCPCPQGTVAIHRFRPKPGRRSEHTSTIANLREQFELEISSGTSGEVASNIGGYHSERDLWYRPEVESSGLPSLIRDAVQEAAQLEAASLKRVPISTSPDEAWLNALGPGGWNQLHTHAGSTYSGVFFVADGGCCESEDGDRLGGRLTFAADAPGQVLSEDQQAHVLTTLARKQSTSMQYLLIDPVPGTCVVFPSFIPHFVIPAAVIAGTVVGSAHIRQSVAFNFGACDPVLAHVLILGGRVKLILEPIEKLAFRLERSRIDEDADGRRLPDQEDPPAKRARVSEEMSCS